MLEPLTGGYSVLVWLLLLADVDCWWCSLDCVDFLKSGCGPSHCSLSICLWYFYFKKVHGPTPSIFDFTGFSSVVPNVTLEVQSPLLLLNFLGNISHNLLAHPWCSLASIPSSLPALVFFWMLCSVFSGSSWALFLVVSFVFFSTLPQCIPGAPWSAFPTLSFLGDLFSGRSQWPHKQIDPGILVWTGFLPHPLRWFFLEGLIGLIKALAWLIRIYLPAVRISSVLRTRFVGQRSCQNPVLILF